MKSGKPLVSACDNPPEIRCGANDRTGSIVAAKGGKAVLGDGVTDLRSRKPCLCPGTLFVTCPSFAASEPGGRQSANHAASLKPSKEIARDIWPAPDSRSSAWKRWRSANSRWMSRIASLPALSASMCCSRSRSRKKLTGVSCHPDTGVSFQAASSERRLRQASINDCHSPSIASKFDWL